MTLFRAVVLACVCWTPSVLVHTQEPKPTQSSRLATVGLLAGVSSTTLAGEDVADNLERRTKPFVGVWVLVDLATRIQLEIDALYSAKGVRSPGVSGNSDFSAGYLEVPALLRLNFVPNARVRPFIGAGAAFGYRVACSTSLPRASGGLGCDDPTVSNPLRVNTTDVSGVAGGGVEIVAGPARLTFGTRFTRGLSSVFRDTKNHHEALTFYFSIGKQQQY